jgi:hypothetical protein
VSKAKAEDVMSKAAVRTAARGRAETTMAGILL